MGTAEARRNIGAFQSDVTGLGRVIQSVSGTSSDLGRTLQSVGNAMVGVGRTLTIAVTAPIAAMGTAALEAGINFEDAFAGVGKTVEGVMTPMGELTELGIRLREEFRDLALEIPMATTELATLGELVGQLGVSAEDVTDVTRLIAMLGETTELSAEDAARGLIQFNNIINGTEGDIVEFLESAGSALVALGNASVSTEGDILNIGLRLAAAGERANFSAQEILAWATTLSDLGVRAEMGGSAVSRMINEMVMAVQTGSDNLGTFANVVDMTVDEFVTAFEEDASGALLNFVGALEEGIDAGRITEDMLNDLGLSGIRVQDVLGRLRNAQELFNNNLDTANKAWKEQIALQEEFNKRAATVKSQIQILKNAFTDLAITIFDLVKDDLKNLIDGIKQLVFDFKNLDPNMQKAIIQFALIAAAIGPVLIVLGSLVTGIGLFVSGITALLSPVGLATAGILGLTAALAAIAIPNLGSILGDLDSIKQAAFDTARALGFVIDVPVAAEGSDPQNATQAEQAIAGGETAPALRLPSFDEFIQNLRDLGNEDINNILSSLDRIGASLGRVFDKIAKNPRVSASLAGIAKSIGKIGDSLKDFAIGALDSIAEFLEDNEDTLATAGQNILILADALGALVAGLIDVGAEIAGGSLDALLNLISALNDLKEGDWEGALANLKEALGSVITAGQGAGVAMGEAGQAVAEAVAGEELPTALESWAGNLENLKIIGQELGTQNAADMALFVGQVVAGFGNAVSGVDTFISEMAGKGAALIQSAIGGILSKLGELRSAVGKGFADAVATAEGKIGDMATAGAALIQAAVNGIKSKAQVLADTASKIAGSAADDFRGFAGSFASAGASFIQGAIAGIQSMIGALIAAAAGAASAASGAFASNLDIGSPSKVTFEMGEFFMMGAIKGIEAQMANLASVSANAGDAALSALEDTFSVNSMIGNLSLALNGVTAPISNTTNNNQSTNFNFGSITGVPLTSENSLAALLQERLKFAGAA